MGRAARPFAQNFDGLTLEGAPLPPGGTCWLGTDLLGRDRLPRLILGARTSLVIGAPTNGIAVVVGEGVGIAGGYAGGWVASAPMRVTGRMMAFPALLLATTPAAIC